MKCMPLYGKYSHLELIVDDEDFEEVKKHRWLYFKNGKRIYVRRTVKDGKLWRHQLLHTFLTGWPLVDHANHNGLDNRRSNLRRATNHQNRMNMLKRVSREGKPSTSQYKGVASKGAKWRAQITVNRKPTHLGTFSSEVEAAHAYDKAARQYFKEFAWINFPEEQDANQ